MAIDEVIEAVEQTTLLIGHGFEMQIAIQNPGSGVICSNQNSSNPNVAAAGPFCVRSCTHRKATKQENHDGRTIPTTAQTF